MDIMWKICCFFLFLLVLQNAHSCIVTNSHIIAGKCDRKMENIVYVRLFQQHSFHIHSEEKKTKKQPFEIKPVRSETRNRTSDGFTNLILTGGLTGTTSRCSPSPVADQYQESGHYAPLKALRAQSICYYFSSAGCI